MKKKILAAAILCALLAAMLTLTGCFNELLYGTWRLSYVADEHGENPQEYMYPVTFELRKNGDVYMMISTSTAKYANFKKDRHTFVMTYDHPDSTAAASMSGSWVIVNGENATELHIFPDDKPCCYILQRTTKD